jgi:nucleotide-binding universal stress UspA family protein
MANKKFGGDIMNNILFEKALVPINESDLSERVVAQAANCVKSGMVGEITLLSVWEADEIDYTKLHAAEKEERLKGQARQALSKYTAYLQNQGIAAHAILVGGDPSDVIMEMIKKENFDLVIMGSRKINKIQELVFGSVSDRVTRLSSVPLLIVK